MTQEEAVEGAMLDFNTRFPLINEECKTYVRYLFNLVWVVGWEHRSKIMGGHNPKPVEQFMTNGNLSIKVYPSVRIAAEETKYSYGALLRRIDTNKTTHKGRFYWRYVKSVE